MVLLDHPGLPEAPPTVCDGPAERAPRRISRAPSHTHRVVSTLAAVGLVGPAFAIWAGIIETPAAGALAVCPSLAGMVLAVGAATASSERRMAWVDAALLVSAIGAPG